MASTVYIDNTSFGNRQKLVTSNNPSISLVLESISANAVPIDGDLNFPHEDICAHQQLRHQTAPGMTYWTNLAKGTRDTVFSFMFPC